MLSQHSLVSVLGVTGEGTVALQGVNRCPNLVAVYGGSLIDRAHLASLNQNRAAYNDFGIANALTGAARRSDDRQGLVGVGPATSSCRRASPMSHPAYCGNRVPEH